MMNFRESEQSKREHIRHNTLMLATAAQQKDLAARYALGEITVGQVFSELYSRLKDPDLIVVLGKLQRDGYADMRYTDEQQDDKHTEWKNMSEIALGTPDDPHEYISRTEMLEAQAHGISNETYMHNKTLPMYKRLALPAWEMIFALNYKEKRHSNER